MAGQISISVPAPTAGETCRVTVTSSTCYPVTIVMLVGGVQIGQGTVSSQGGGVSFSITDPMQGLPYVVTARCETCLAQDSGTVQ